MMLSIDDLFAGQRPSGLTVRCKLRLQRMAWRGFLVLLFVFPQPLDSIAEDVDYSDQLPRIKPTPAEQALETFAVAGDFEMQLVAAEPLIGSPVAIQWDAEGAMFVCEMRGYSENRQDAISGIARLTDQDGDGVYDTRTQYAAGLLWPTALFPYDGGLFVGDAPDLWYFKDNDGDGVADLKRRVLTGFGRSNVQGLMNSFRWGLDNRIHVACSSVGGTIRVAVLPSADSAGVDGVKIRGRDLAFDPRTGAFRPTSGAAQHGMCFDDWGNKFVSSNSDHLQQVMYEDRYLVRNPFVKPPPSRISIASDGPQAEVFRISPVEPWRIVRTRLRVSGKAKGPIEGGGRAAGYFTGATGATIYRGDAWPEKWKGTAIVGDVGSNLIHRKRLTRNSVEFTADRIDQGHEFVASSDIWFRPAQFANAPDGSLHVIDVYREVIEHPKSLPDEIKRHLDLTAGRDRGRIYRLAPKGFRSDGPINLAGKSTGQLVKLLGHPNAWHRETASRLLYERQDPSGVALLERMVHENGHPLARLHALYALDGQRDANRSNGKTPALDLQTRLAALGDDHPQVRRHAIRLAEPVAAEAMISSRMVELAKDPSVEVRYQLAFSAAFLPEAQRVQVLGQILRRDLADRWVSAAVLISARGVGEPLKRELQTDSASDDEALVKEFLSRLDQQIQREAEYGDIEVDSNARSKILVEADRSPSERLARNALVKRYQPAIEVNANHHQGRKLFKKHCSACHRVGEIGQAVGPNLATMKSRGAATVLTAVLDPNREVNPLYNQYSVLTTDGRVYNGMITDEGSTSLTLRDADGKSKTVLAIEIDQIKDTGRSMMPEGFEDQLDIQAMADLIGFLTE